MKIKRIFASALVATSVFGLAACGEEEVTKTEELPVEEVDPKDVELIPHFEDLTINDVVNFLQYTDFDQVLDNLIKEYQTTATNDGKYIKGTSARYTSYKSGDTTVANHNVTDAVMAFEDSLKYYEKESTHGINRYTKYTPSGIEYASYTVGDSDLKINYGTREYEGSFQNAIGFLTELNSLETISQYASMFESYKDTAFEYIMPYINGDANLTDDIDAMMNQTLDLQKALKVLDPFITTGTEEVEKPLGFINVNVTLAGVKISIDHEKISEFVSNYSDANIGDIVNNLYPTEGDESRSEVIVDFLESPQFQEAWYTISNLLIKAFGESQSAENQVIAVPADGLKVAKVSEIATPTPKEMDFLGMVIDLPYVIESILKGAKVGDFANYFDMLNYVDVQAFSKFDNKLQLSGIEAQIGVIIPDLETNKEEVYNGFISYENNNLVVIAGAVQDLNASTSAFDKYIKSLSNMKDTDDKADIIDEFLYDATIVPFVDFSVRNDEDTNEKLIDLTYFFNTRLNVVITENSFDAEGYILQSNGEKEVFMNVNAEVKEEGLVFAGKLDLTDRFIEFDNNHLFYAATDNENSKYEEISIEINKTPEIGDKYFTYNDKIYDIVSDVVSQTPSYDETVSVTKIENGVNIHHYEKTNAIDIQYDDINITLSATDKATKVNISSETSSTYYTKTDDTELIKHENSETNIDINVYSLDFSYIQNSNYYYTDLNGGNKTDDNKSVVQLDVITEPDKLFINSSTTRDDYSNSAIITLEISSDKEYKETFIKEVEDKIKEASDLEALVLE